MISVIIPAYNSEDCLERCVKSVCAQTYRDIEIIIVDDGSTDSTFALAKSLSEEDPRIRVFTQPNAGTSAARNLGLREARGEYIGFVDADDYVEPFMYEKLLSTQTPALKIAQICRDEISADGSPLPMVVTPPESPEVIAPEAFLKELLLHRGDCSMCTKLVHRSLFHLDSAEGREENLFPEGELNEDFKIFIRMLAEVDGVGSLPDIGYHVCYRPGSNSRGGFSRVYRDIVVNADWVSELVDTHYPELNEYARRFALVQRLDYLMHIPVKEMVRKEGIGYTFYASVTDYLRKHRSDIRRNPYLNEDQRKKLMIMSVVPRFARSVHGIIMKIRG